MCVCEGPLLPDWLAADTPTPSAASGGAFSLSGSGAGEKFCAHFIVSHSRPHYYNRCSFSLPHFVDILYRYVTMFLHYCTLQVFQ